MTFHYLHVFVESDFDFLFIIIMDETTTTTTVAVNQLSIPIHDETKKSKSLANTSTTWWIMVAGMGAWETTTLTICPRVVDMIVPIIVSPDHPIGRLYS